MSTQLNMAGGLREFSRSSPHRVAVVDGDRELTFAAVHERSNRLASGLLDRGLRPGEPVAVLSGNRLEYFEIATALAKAGLPMVPLNPRNAVGDNAYILGHSQARALLLDDDLADTVEGLVDGFEQVLSFGGTAGPDYETFIADARDSDPAMVVDEHEAFCLSYTSGTTGKP